MNTINKIKNIEQCKVLEKSYLTKDVVKLVIENAEIAKTALPGQFLNIKCGNDSSLVLRRPISINDINRDKKTISIVFRIVGKGTELLAEAKINDMLDVMGPLGNTFNLDVKENEKIAIIAGGMGVMPVLYLAKTLKKEFPSCELDTFLGYRDKNEVMLEDEYGECADNVVISTDNGSYGHNGFITNILKKQMQAMKYDKIYACGPKPMFINLKKVLDETDSNDIDCQISLEEKMGCGIGACLVCSCKIKTQNEDGFSFKRVCKDGPVFNIKEVIFE